MTWMIIEGVDRSGKSTLAKHYESLGYKYIHFSAPDKKFYTPGYTGPSYLDSIIETILPLSGQDVIFDRSWYGETIWPNVYNRQPLLSEDDLDILREIESQNSTFRILMSPKDVSAHWQRCVDNKEKLTKSEFDAARSLYLNMSEKYNFNLYSLEDFSSIKETLTANAVLSIEEQNEPQQSQDLDKQKHNILTLNNKNNMTPEQLKLQQANAVNEILSSRIIKKKGTEFDLIEAKIREFLNQELAMLLGTNSPHHKAQTALPFSDEEVNLLKAVASRLKNKRA